jgi:hypothetical protein
MFPFNQIQFLNNLIKFPDKNNIALKPARNSEPGTEADRHVLSGNGEFCSKKLNEPSY